MSLRNAANHLQKSVCYKTLACISCRGLLCAVCIQTCRSTEHPVVLHSDWKSAAETPPTEERSNPQDKARISKGKVVKINIFASKYAIDVVRRSIYEITSRPIHYRKGSSDVISHSCQKKEF